MRGVMSIIPTDGMIWRSGARIGSVTTYDQWIHLEYGEIGSHELTTLTMSAMRRKSNSHETTSVRIPRGPFS